MMNCSLICSFRQRDDVISQTSAAHFVKLNLSERESSADQLFMSLVVFLQLGSSIRNTIKQNTREYHVFTQCNITLKYTIAP